MNNNMGSFDRKVRALLGTILLILGIYLYYSLDNRLNGLILIILSIPPIITSILGSCILYNWLGINTNSGHVIKNI